MTGIRTQDRETLTAIAADDVVYQPGREHDTNSEARTRYSFQQYKPGTVGLKCWKRVTASVNRLVDAGLAEFATPDKRCKVTLTQAGRDLLDPKPVTLEGVKEGDIITVRVFSARSEKYVTRRVRVHSCYVWNGLLMVQGVYANKDGSKSKVQPRFGNMPMVEAKNLIAINA